VRDLYASAAYEDALAVAGRLDAAGASLDIDQYRVFCLIALGRTEEAEKTIEAVVNANPMYVPDPSETSPRVQEVFTRIRRQMLPGIARAKYTEAKRAFDSKDARAAASRFDALVKLIDGAAAGGDTTLAELRLLASGFLDLSQALVAAEVAAEAAASPPDPTPPAAPAAAEPSGQPPQITRPVAISQEFPPWVPVDAVSRQTEFVGSVRVRILASGAVESAEILQPVHPAYDRALLLAARAWQYEPARQNGVPVPAEHVVEVRLRPRE
jgi:TonB family protein